MKELTRITKLLAEYQVEFVIAGGLGTFIHGSSLMTQDVDVACRMEPDNLLRLFQALETLRPLHRMAPERLPFTRMQAEQGGLKNLYLSTNWGHPTNLSACLGTHI